MALRNSSIVSGSWASTSLKFVFTLVKLFIPHIVEIRHLGGRERMSYRCLATGSVMFVIDGMSTSRMRDSASGFDTIRFICNKLQSDTRIFSLAASSAASSGPPATFLGS